MAPPCARTSPFLGKSSGNSGSLRRDRRPDLRPPGAGKSFGSHGGKRWSSGPVPRNPRKPSRKTTAKVLWTILRNSHKREMWLQHVCRMWNSLYRHLHSLSYIYMSPPRTPPHAVCTGIYIIKKRFFMFNCLGLLTYVYLSKHYCFWNHIQYTV